MKNVSLAFILSFLATGLAWGHDICFVIGEQCICSPGVSHGQLEECTRKAPTVKNACSSKFTDPNNVQFCRGHCAEAPLLLLEVCTQHAAWALNTDRRNEAFKFTPQLVCIDAYAEPYKANYCSIHCGYTLTWQMDQCLRQVEAEMNNTKPPNQQNPRDPRNLLRP